MNPTPDHDDPELPGGGVVVRELFLDAHGRPCPPAQAVTGEIEVAYPDGTTVRTYFNNTVGTDPGPCPCP